MLLIESCILFIIFVKQQFINQLILHLIIRVIWVMEYPSVIFVSPVCVTSCLTHDHIIITFLWSLKKWIRRRFIEKLSMSTTFPLSICIFKALTCKNLDSNVSCRSHLLTTNTSLPAATDTPQLHQGLFLPDSQLGHLLHDHKLS